MKKKRKNITLHSTCYVAKYIYIIISSSSSSLLIHIQFEWLESKEVVVTWGYIINKENKIYTNKVFLVVFVFVVVFVVVVFIKRYARARKKPEIMFKIQSSEEKSKYTHNIKIWKKVRVKISRK